MYKLFVHFTSAFKVIKTSKKKKTAKLQMGARNEKSCVTSKTKIKISTVWSRNTKLTTFSLLSA